jgi:hypothetical protein
MARWMAGLFVGGLALALAANCSSKDEDDDDDNDTSGTDSGLLDVEQDTGNVDVPPCENIEGLDVACDFVAQEAQALQVNILLVMDKSGSMSETPAGYSGSKWDALQTALSTALTEVQGAISFGLEFFPTTASIGSPIPYECGDSGRCCEMPGGADMNVPVDVGTTTVPQIVDALSLNQPAGGTPTAAALYRALDYFTNGAGAALEGDKYVLLATDGAPNCNSETTCDVSTCTLNLENKPGCPPDGVSCCDSNHEGCLDDTATVQQITDLRAAGVQTIVVGIPGSELYGSNLQQFAENGGFARPDGSTGYFEVSAEGGVDALTETFRTITTQLVTDCEIPLPPELDDSAVNRNDVNVAVECEVIRKGEESNTESEVDQWVWDNADPALATSIIVQGPTCERIQTEGVGRIDVVLGCPAVTIY